MKKLLVAALSAPLLLAGCGHHHTVVHQHVIGHQGGGYGGPTVVHQHVHQHTTVIHNHAPSRPRISLRKH